MRQEEEQVIIDLDVRGMTCPSCGGHVQHALEGVAGVVSADVPGWQSSRAAGVTAVQARKAGHDVQTSTLPLRYVPRALAARDTRGLIKLVADRVTGRLLGAHILAAEGGEVVQSAVLAIKFGLTLDDLTGTLFPYLTQVEGLKLAAQTFSKDVEQIILLCGVALGGFRDCYDLNR